MTSMNTRDEQPPIEQQQIIVLDGTSLPDRELIGGKAWSIARMTGLGLRVPPAFVIPISECIRYHSNGRTIDDGLWDSVLDGVRAIEEATGRRFGDPHAPLLVSVRSGAAISMPGMMDTVLNLGITDEVERGLAHITGDENYARDTHARFCHQFGDIVLKAHLDPYTSGPTANQMRELVLEDVGESIPDDPYAQLRAAISAVFDSWTSARARSYRKHWGISDEGGTAVTVQAMVFGNLGDHSGTGVLFTRNPLNGEPTPYGEWLPGGQGDDVVGGTHSVLDLSALAADMPAVHEELLSWAGILENEHREVQDVEFTIESGRLYLLQTRTAKRSPDAAVRIATDLVGEGYIDAATAVLRVTPEQVASVLLPSLSDEALAGVDPVASGEAACPGVAIGVGVVDPDEAERRAKNGEDVVLVRPTTSPNDVHGMIAAVAVVTDLGGSTSHAAVVTRALGRPSVVGVGDGVAESLEGQVLTVDGASGRVYAGALPLQATTIDDHPALGPLARWATEHCPITVVAHHAGEILDLDVDHVGVDPETGRVDEAQVAAALRNNSQPVRGSVLNTAEGARALMSTGTSRAIADPPLPLQLRILQVVKG
jgi:pyruvate, orthophosphate dikinase